MDKITPFLLIVFALFLVAALLSYDSSDKGVLYSNTSTPNPETQNICGSFGAFCGNIALFFFGFAAFYIPTLLIWISLHWLWVKPPSKRVWFGIILQLISSACILAIQPWFFTNWITRWHIPGVGGAIGMLIGGNNGNSIAGQPLIFLLERYLHPLPALAVCLIIFVIAISWSTNNSLWNFLRIIFLSSRNWLRNRAEKRQEKTFQEEALQEEHTVSKIKRTARRKPNSTASSDKQTTTPEEFETQPTPSSKPKPKTQKTSKKKSKNSAEETLFSNQQIIDTTKQNQQKNTSSPQPRTTEGPDFPGYQVPSITLLPEPEPVEDSIDEEQLLETQQVIIDTLQSFKVNVTAGDITRGPSVTRYEVYPSKGLKVANIVSCEADLALATCAKQINILAPIPGKNTVGIEIANEQRTLVTIREILQDKEFTHKKKIPIALGKDVYGRAVVGDLETMPHLLVAGATGSGKSVCINSIISSILFRFSPDELRFILIDPKVVEMQMYNALPHLVFPVITEPKKVILALRWVVNEMERRYRLLGRVKVRKLADFNKRDRSLDPQDPTPPSSTELDESELEHIERIGRALDGEGEDPEPTAMNEADLFADPDEPIPDKLPYIVVIIDELADLMQMVRADIEAAIQRITQKARAAGIHLILATQTPRSEVITGTIKANIPSRIAFAVSNKIDSRVILDSSGAEKLIGKGDLLFLDPKRSDLHRSQGCFIEDQAVEELVEHCAQQAKPKFTIPLEEPPEEETPKPAKNKAAEADEEMLQTCIEFIQGEKTVSVSSLQRNLRIGYNRASRMVDILEERGYVGPKNGAKGREVLLSNSEE